MITIDIPDNYKSERCYILAVMFDFIGDFDIQFNFSYRKDISITTDTAKELRVADGLFKTQADQWLQPASLPTQPLAVWELSRTSLFAKTLNPFIPVIYGNDPSCSTFFRQSRSQIYLGLDIFGSAFFMLTRYEELVKPDRDQHNRFPASASLAYQEGFLDRPIINEYLEILWACLKYLWPSLERRKRQFQTFVSHDVDEPFRYAFSGIFPILRSGCGDILKRRRPVQAFKKVSHWCQVKAGRLEFDPCNTFDWIMDISEQHNLKSTFYFITNHSAGSIDGIYEIDHPFILRLLKKIHMRGHEIGLHTSYNTYRDIQQTKNEFEILKKICASINIERRKWGVRQHYLRWETPTTFQNLDEAGFDYDSTLSFADFAGFRCGVCYEFLTFNLQTRQSLNLIERPLIVMECTILDPRYMNLGLDRNVALEAIIKYKQRCQFFDGNFTLLWHNSRLINPHEVSLYEGALSL